MRERREVRRIKRNGQIQRMQGAGETKGLSGIMTVELAYLMPILLLVFQIVIYSTFYYHDKSVLLASASETAVVAASYERRNGAGGQVDLESFFREQTAGKLILFSRAEMDVSQTNERVKITVSAEKGWIRLEVMQRAVILKPEVMLRRTRAIKGFLPGEEEAE